MVEWRGYEARRWQQRRRKDPLQARRVLESVSLSLRLTNDILHSAFPKYVCSFIPAWLLFQASCMRSFSFLPATAILLRGLVRRKGDWKDFSLPRLPKNLKIYKEERKKRFFTNISPPDSNPYWGLCYFYFFSTISLLRPVAENGWAVSSTARRT